MPVESKRVEKVLQHRFVDSELEFLIVREGMGTNEATWEPSRNFISDDGGEWLAYVESHGLLAHRRTRNALNA